MPTDPAFIRAVEGLKELPAMQYSGPRERQAVVRVVLNAIREPDEAALSVLSDLCRDQARLGIPALDIYRAMIDAILIQGEGSQPQQFMPDVPMVVDKVTGRFKLAGKIDTATGEVRSLAEPNIQQQVLARAVRKAVETGGEVGAPTFDERTQSWSYPVIGPRDKHLREEGDRQYPTGPGDHDYWRIAVDKNPPITLPEPPKYPTGEEG